MATNPLTGGFEAVVQIAVRQVDALLATFHQDGSSTRPLKLPHSVQLSVDNRRRSPDLDEFADWTLGFHQARSRPGADVRGGLIGAAPVGAAARMRDVFQALDDSLVITDPPGVIRGRADVQLSSVTITVPQDSTSEITTHTHIRAQYKPVPGTTDLPAPIHGEVEATFDIRNVQSGDGRRLEITPSASDAKILFHPEPGTVDAAAAATIATHIRRALRDKFTLAPVDLPDEFPFTAFKGVGTGGNAAIALGLQISKAPPVGGLRQVTQSRVGPAAFALAVSKDFITALFEPAIGELLSGQQNVSITLFEPRFNPGSIDLRIEATATDSILGAVHVSIFQRVTLVVTFDTLFIAALDDELNVDVSKAGVPLPSGDVRSRIITARNQALPSIQAVLNQQLNAAKTRLNGALQKFHESASLTLRPGHSEEPNAEAFGGIVITPDGIFLRGDIRLVDRVAPVVDVRETADETAFTAFESFVPAGRLEEFIWSWVEFKGPSIWSAELKVLPPEKHRFILPKPPGITDRSQLCLLVKGTQILANGTRISIEGGTTCRLPGLEPIMNVPSWWEPVMVPLWRPDIAEDATLRDALVAHVTVQANAAPQSALTHNSLVFFADWQSDAPFAPLSAALERSRRRGVSLVVFVILPCGAFDATRREVEARMAAIGHQMSSNLHVTEDDEGGWSRTFAPSKRPAAFLINGRRQVAWTCDGSLDADALGAAISRRLDVAPPPRAVPIRLNASVGDRLLDAEFRDGSGQPASLHRLQGGRALLHFFLSWSAPCRRELRRLQQMWDGKGDRPSIVAFHGGPASYLDALRKELGLTFPIVQDVEQEVARTYGVRCWPTTVQIDSSGRIEHVQFGMSYESKGYTSAQAS